MLVEIYSDVVCPWCYIGKRRFEEAMASYEGRYEVTVVWRPFQLDPRAPTEPTPVIDAYARKFGGPEQAFAIIDHVTSVAADAGLELHLDLAKRSNTFDAHRVLALALDEGGPELQGRVNEALLRAYFTEGRHVGDPDVLVEVAADTGLDPENVRTMLASEASRARTHAELVEAYERGITAVPTFVVDGKWAIPGAQDPETFLRVLRRLGPPPEPGGTCTDDVCDV